MKRNIFITLAILVFLGCSQNKPDPKASAKEKVDIRITDAKSSVPADFVPEHIKRSKIEVVKHY